MKLKEGDHFHKVGPKGLKLVIDVRDDQTPCLVQDRTGRYSATFDCATGEGELMGSRDCMSLTDEQLAWLEKQEDLNEQAYAIARKDWKD